jgi:hypothetical protein
MSAAIDWTGILVGLLGVLYAVAVVLGSREGGSPEQPRRFCPFWSPFVALGVVAPGLILAGYLVSLLREPPFSGGGRLGLGFLIGGAWAFAAALIMPWAKALIPLDLRPERRWVAGNALSAGFSSWTLAGANATLLAFKGNPIDALMGFGLGFATVAILVRAAGDGASTARGQIAGWEGMGPQGIFAAALVTACSLGVYHFRLTEQRIWWSLPLAAAGVAIAATIIASRIGALGRLGQREGGRLFVTGLIGLPIVGLLALLIATKVLHSWPMFGCVVIGLSSAGLIAWLIVGASAEGNGGIAFQAAAFGGVVVMAMVAACFKLLAGYGVALALCAGWAIVVPVAGVLTLAPEAHGERWAAWGAGLMPFAAAWALVAAYRLFLEHCEGEPLAATVHYAFIGFAVGAIIMLVYAGYGARTGRVASSHPPGWGELLALLRTGVIGVVSVALPLGFTTLWGQRATAGLVAGMAVGGLVLAAWQLSGADRTSLAPGTVLLGLGSALAAVQLTHLALPLLMGTRATKLVVVLVVAGIALVWVLVDAACACLRRRREGAA